MKLPADLQAVVDAARRAAAGPGVARRAIGLVDLTSLETTDTTDTAAALCRRAVTPAGSTAAVCLWPRLVAGAKAALAGTGVRIATVVNFPGGDEDPGKVADDTRAAIADGADEIDVVLPYRSFIDGARSQPASVLRACREACGDAVLMKVILESGAFPDPDLLNWAARDAIGAGADFLKTSTGKTQPAATPEAAALMLHAIAESGRPVGFKASGGIRDTAAAAVYLDLADRLMGDGWATPHTFRFGASGLLDALLADLGGFAAPGTPGDGY